jgi:hypothetical protein
MFSLAIVVGNTDIYLLGPDIEAPVKGCRRRPGKEIERLVEEQIDVILQGDPGLIDGWVRMMEAKFSLIASGAMEAVLKMQPESRTSPYESRLKGGKIGFLGHGSADMKHGGMGVVLTLTRELYWEGGLQAVPLLNVHGSDVVDGLVIDNHFAGSGLKNNYAVINGINVGGELPAPVWLSIENTSNGKVLGKVLIGQDCFYNLDISELWLEGESSNFDAGVVTFTATADTNSSNGAYGLAAWSGTDEVELLSGEIGYGAPNKYGGRMVRPVLRLAVLPGSDDYWVRWCVRQGEASEYSAWQQLDDGLMQQDMPVIHIPPGKLGDGNLDDTTVALMCRRDAIGTHDLAVDFAALMPLDGWREYQSLGDGGLAFGEKLVDDLGEKLLYSENASGYKKLTHQGIGKGIWLMPGEGQTLYFLFDEAGGGWSVDDQVKLKVNYRPRRKNL